MMVMMMAVIIILLTFTSCTFTGLLLETKNIMEKSSDATVERMDKLSSETPVGFLKTCMFVQMNNNATVKTTDKVWMWIHDAIKMYRPDTHKLQKWINSRQYIWNLALLFCKTQDYILMEAICFFPFQQALSTELPAYLYCSSLRRPQERTKQKC